MAQSGAQSARAVTGVIPCSPGSQRPGRACDFGLVTLVPPGCSGASAGSQVRPAEARRGVGRRASVPSSARLLLGPGLRNRTCSQRRFPSLVWVSPDLPLWPEVTESDGQAWGPPQETPWGMGSTMHGEKRGSQRKNDGCPARHEPHWLQWVGACGCLEGRWTQCPPGPREHWASSEGCGGGWEGRPV